MRKLVLTINLLLLVLGSLLGSKKDKADKNFSDLSFDKAISKYLKVVEKGDSSVARNLAESYLRLNDHTNSVRWYEVVIERNEQTEKDIFNYAEAVKATENYDKYEDIVNAYSSLKTHAATVDNSEIIRMQKKNLRFDVVPTNLNTPHSDCSPTFLNDNSIVFMSDRKLSGIKWKKHSWSGDHFYNLLIANTTEKVSDLEGISSFSDAINTKYEEGPATFSGDGNTMIFSHTVTRNLSSSSTYLTEKAVGNLELSIASYDNELQSWSIIEPFPIRDSIYEMEHPCLSPDGKTLYFSSDHPYPGHQGKHDIYKVEKDSEGKWSSPINLGKGVNTERNEGFPFIQPKTGELFFSSDGHPGLGKLDIFVSNKVDDVYLQAVNIGFPINSSSDDFGVTFNKDMSLGYFSSDRSGGEGMDDIYGIIVNYYPFKLEGLITDDSGKPLDKAIVKLFDGKGEMIDSLVTSASGRYNFESVEHEEEYAIEVNKTDYKDQRGSFKENNFKIPLIVKDFSLSMIPTLEDLPSDLTPELVAQGDFDTIEQVIIFPINFDFDKYEVNKKENKKLLKIADILSRDSLISLEIYSHTDCRGPRAYNEILSRKRARSTKEFLVKHGVKQDQIVLYKGMGESQPIYTCECSDGGNCSEKQHYVNRRSEFVLRKVNQVIKSVTVSSE